MITFLKGKTCQRRSETETESGHTVGCHWCQVTVLPASVILNGWERAESKGLVTAFSEQ